MAGDRRDEALVAKEAGNAEYRKRNFDAALQHYEKAIELDPTDMSFRTNKAAVYFEQKDYQKCIAECNQAIEVGRENRADFKLIAKAYARMAGAYVKLEDYPNARTYYQKSLTEHRIPDTLSKLSEATTPRQCATTQRQSSVTQTTPDCTATGPPATRSLPSSSWPSRTARSAYAWTLNSVCCANTVGLLNGT
ncbi:hypothetical protein HPB51_012478 [Rhipicephalus microplus]|uniref:Uncharacterized protein n=1 Tax=Rhipicephalus microplus TaxID=6941 RepID=A0A9J6E9J8_RHIMP|nr:hypothetical protein HPB51_012478 [Rhipicephalus microplus]